MAVVVGVVVEVMIFLLMEQGKGHKKGRANIARPRDRHILHQLPLMSHLEGGGYPAHVTSV